ncbi:hypothetical protein [Vibrio hangzhouensis]|uniref:Uncharacterized protein n=1 Tax=Vibrio hangzhouensis TaxID=462991 RepID=A0A1H6AF87_9VIBR|nr:hypothetical protein [Vibrio hangzhouensis]SEG46727.1 hypothetical protein SAMN04488244_11525 [Vibrio hangzhouensis]
MTSWFNKALIEVAQKLRPMQSDFPDYKEIDRYTVLFSLGEQEFLLREVEGDSVQALLRRDDGSWAKEMTQFAVGDLASAQFDIRHEYRHCYYDYTNKTLFALATQLSIHKVLHVIEWGCYQVPNVVMRFKKLRQPTRLSVLMAIEQITVGDPYIDINATRVCNHLYGTRSVYNSKRSSLVKRVGLILESLAESQELKATQSINFRVTGKALVTTEHLLEERNKERRSERNATAMRWLTAALVVIGMFQSELLRTEFYISIDTIVSTLSSLLGDIHTKG